MSWVLEEVDSNLDVVCLFVCLFVLWLVLFVFGVCAVVGQA